jgi:hypothetical protein
MLLCFNKVNSKFQFSMFSKMVITGSLLQINFQRREIFGRILSAKYFQENEILRSFSK